MPEILQVLLPLVAAVAVFVLVRTVVGRRIAAAVALARAESESARAVLEERLAGRDGELAAARVEIGETRSAEARLRDALSDLRAREAQLETQIEAERAQATEKLALLDTAQKKLADAFQALASEALGKNNAVFLDLAREKLEAARAEAQGELEARRQAIEGVVAPLREQLDRYEEGLRDLERSRQMAYGTLLEQVRQMGASQEGLVRETRSLVTALRRPEVRGNWGEVQLRRAVEFAGLLDRVDFVTQESVATDNGRLRPDLVVRLPGDRQVVVDAKTPLDAFLSAIEATNDDERRAHLERHAKQVRTHLQRLGEKRYWDQFEGAADFVVLFLPGEAFFSAALEQDPTLIEDAFKQSVLVATPSTLVALLKTVAYGWRQESLAVNAREISAAARELYDRLRVFAGHLAGVRKGLGAAVDCFNKAMSSYQTRVLPSGRRLEELGPAQGESLEALEPLDVVPRALAPGEDAGDPGSSPPTA